MLIATGEIHGRCAGRLQRILQTMRYLGFIRKNNLVAYREGRASPISEPRRLARRAFRSTRHATLAIDCIVNGACRPHALLLDAVA